MAEKQQLKPKKKSLNTFDDENLFFFLYRKAIIIAKYGFEIGRLDFDRYYANLDARQYQEKYSMLNSTYNSDCSELDAEYKTLSKAVDSESEQRIAHRLVKIYREIGFLNSLMKAGKVSVQTYQSLKEEYLDSIVHDTLFLDIGNDEDDSIIPFL